MALLVLLLLVHDVCIVAALPVIRQRVSLSSFLPLRALSPSLMDPIIDHPAISELCVKLRPRSRLKEHHKHLFLDRKHSHNNSSASLLFDELALVACSTGVVCRKELLETYAAATFIHAKFPHMKRMADLAAGHGLLSWFLLAMDHYEMNDDDDTNDSSSSSSSTRSSSKEPRTVVCVDRRMPSSADAIATAMIHRFPALEQRWSYVESDLSAVVPHPSCVLTSVHACGTLSDFLVDMAIRTGASLAIVPCCHTVKEQMGYRPHVLSGMDAEEVAILVEERKKKQENAKHEAVADVVDEVRCRTLRNAGYDVEEVMLPEEFTARNRVILGERPTRADGVVEAKSQQFFQRQGKVATMPPLIRIPLADDHESIAYCHAVSGRVRAATKSPAQTPTYFSLHMSIWVAGEEDSSGKPVATVQALQAFVDQFCGENEKEEIQCTVEIFGEVDVQSTTGRLSQLYRFQYSKPEDSADRSRAGVWRIAAKRIHRGLRESIVDKFGDVLR
eukprot:CAMPEP_0119030348 /NCGR_PEP_ID=MMETSP1176-20130426/40986_1 /TAXON_ID=265551 /ORGANISM="Synedropsis recta cf, Strain CCMP1620" /LENGTH=502 /DNA_ID=CAMNT_0006986717 /DNA_START=142 /DNA_END=1650 /DNA_ORIENTATION=-